MRRDDRQIALDLAVGRGVGAERAERLGQLLDVMLNFVRAAFVGVRGRHQHARKSRHPLAIDRRKIGAAEKRLRVGREEHRQRPSAASGDHLHRFHVDLIEVGPLLAIDFDGNEIFVHQPRDAFVLERLALHHVAPMARRIANREQDGFVFGFRARERLVAPRIPIDGIVGVLAQIRTLLVDQSIGLAPGMLMLVAHGRSFEDGDDVTSLRADVRATRSRLSSTVACADVHRNQADDQKRIRRASFLLDGSSANTSQNPRIDRGAIDWRWRDGVSSRSPRSSASRGSARARCGHRNFDGPRSRAR